jgi:hypothetical protein
MNSFPVTSKANTTGFSLLCCAAVLLVGSVIWKNKSGEGTMADIGWTVIVFAGALAIIANSILFTFD